MWTPRRLLLLLIGVAVCTAIYFVYFQVLGRYDGLPQLPDEYYVRRTADDADLVLPPRGTLIDIKLQRAFGSGCLETGYNHRIELQKNGVILATNQLSIEPDGRCKLKPFSIAVVKDRGPGRDAEIYTAHSDEAFILFDEPAKNLADMGKRRIVGCDLNSDSTLLSPDPRRHRITCNHNRGTADPNDDLVVETIGPVQYRERSSKSTADTPQVTTTAAVRLVDRRGQPQSTTMTAQGMRIFLATIPAATTPPAKSKAKAGGGGITGVQRVVLPDNVTMNLWLDPKDGFLSAAKPSGGSDPPPERSNVQITTPGHFVYEVGESEDKARFEMKPAAGPNDRPGFVQVVRPIVKDNVTLYDRLDCDILEMQFAHGAQANGEAAASKTEPGNSLQWIHAWGQYVVVTSQAENMQAHASDLFHEAAAKRTTLRGKPEVVATKDGHEIHAPELVLINSDGKAGQEAFARGAGWFRGLAADQAAGDNRRTLSARWQNEMHYRKEDGQELVTFSGGARVEDPDRKQILTGEQIKITLAPDTSGTPTAGNGPKMKPRRLEVTGRVAGQSAELVIQDTDLLVVLFRDGTTPVASTSPPVVNGSLPIANTPGSPNPNASGSPTEAPTSDKRPLFLAAKSVQAFMTVNEPGPMEIDNVHCEGSVKVHQDPASPQEKPLDITGDTLQLKHLGEGHELTVNGETDRPAEVHLPDLSLLGPTVKMNQQDNTSDVDGPGSMRILSTTDFQGNKLAQPTELTVNWKQQMHFNGSTAHFQGNVQATQDNTSLLCQVMQVTLDKPVRFNQSNSPSKDPKAASVKKIVCETGADGAAPVSVVDSLREGGRMVRYQRIESRQLAVFKDENHAGDNRFEAQGPGEVRILQLGPKDVGKAPAPNAPPPGANDEEMKLTYVRYDHKLTVLTESRIAKFWKNVEVLHIPADDPGLHLNMNQLINKLPPRALYLKCDLLTVYTQDQGAKKFHIMVAERNSSVQFDNFYGQADVIKYNEEQQQVIFEGVPGRPASLTKLKARGQQPMKTHGQKFTYNRITGRLDGNDVTSISE